MDKSDLIAKLRFERNEHRLAPEPADWARRRWLGIAGTGALLLVVGVAAFQLQGETTAQAQPEQAPAAEAELAAAPRKSATARNAADGVLLQATGYVAARREATVSAQITGMLIDVRVEEGDRVEQGQVIALLDSKGHSAALRAAEASALAATAEAELVRAEVDQGARNARRQAELLESQLVSREMAEQAQTELVTAQARLRAAQRRAESAQADLQSADVAIGHTEVKAPFGGVVIHKAAQAGEIVSPQSNGGFTRSGICTIVDMESLEVDVDVNEAYIGRVAAGMPAEIVLDAYPDWRIAAHVVAIVPTADRGKATVRVRVGFALTDPRIVPDMGARVSFLERPRAVQDAPAPPPRVASSGSAGGGD
ncbi:efflux RND transporter periplasmic adaptor subunit [Stenotrophomonas maltophilia]|nr:efflux RND transporter periplasmic adaptor subunit [Stenotrophomonas maltophilia]MBN5135104.1 efflux RND transporter periplasmic adaptor subunit [Stenotrophomonas maltophilia]